MFPPFNQEIAHHYCEKTISDIENGILELQQVTEISQERLGQGLMVGCLVCWDSKANKRVVLLAVSGISRQLKGETDSNTIIVPPIVSNKEINQVLQKNDEVIHQLTYKIQNSKNPEEIEVLTKQRTLLTDESLQKVFDLYSFTCFDGKKITLNQIIKEKHKLPPTGTGDCCAPKLLSYAFKNGYLPISMDEVYYGKDTKNKKNGCSYGPCDERCGFILPSILGLEILYRDKDIIVINKKSGMLSVPGRGEDKQDCVANRIRTLIPECIQQPSVHRLDMETSGVMVFALNEKSHRELNRQFAEGLVHKKYCALLDGVLATAKGNLAPKKGEKNGRIELKFRLDVDNRPHQIYDEENGKLGITEWENLGTEYYTNPETGLRKKVTRIIYSPKTGRTHQLRLASSDIHGFGLPIVGDTLYGECLPGERLMLHAFELKFFHPTSGEQMEFSYCAFF